MVKRGRHAADDGSSVRGAGMATGRAAALLGLAVILGIVLLNAVDDSPSGQVSAGGGRTTTTTAVTTTTTATTTTTVAARAPKDVKALAANGTDVKGAGRRATDTLRTAGYNVLAPVDAAKKTDATVVYFAAGFEAEARTVATALAVPTTAVQALPAPPPVPDLRGANVVVVVGPELAARLLPATTTTKAGAVTTTTKAGAVTTTTKAATSGTTTP